MESSLAGAALFVVCAVLIGGAVAVGRRLQRQDAVRSSRASAWSDRTTRLIEHLHGATFERITFDGDDPRLVFVGELRSSVTIPEWPTVVVGTQVLRFGDAGFREAISSLHGDKVRSARISSDSEVVIELSGGSFLIEPRSAQ